MEEENKLITQNVNDFISKNTKRYEIDIVNTLSKETYQDTIQEIQKQSDIHFKDHSSSIFFFYKIVQASFYHFKELELILDIIIHFSTEIKAKTSEIELISICVRFSNGLNYLFDKNFFSISSIIEQSRLSDEIFITFLPEITEYDKEYSEIREKIFFSKENSELLTEYYQFVKNHPKEHIFYRKSNYHPSPLHKAIRNDDIQTFQSILSQNNYSVNHRIEYSFYERLRKTLDENMSLIQIAAFYGSLNIFKFLWMQTDIDLNYNLMDYAFAGQNIDIIHYCEEKCKIGSSYIQPIFTHSPDILDYCIYKYDNEIIVDENDVIQNDLKDFAKNEDNSYEILNSNSLSQAIFSSNFEVIKQCLRKIVFLSRNYEQLNRTDFMNNISFLPYSNLDFELFKFLYSQRKQDIDIQTVPSYPEVVFTSVVDNANDSIKFMLNELKNMRNLYFLVFKKGIKYNHVIANYILDLQLMEDHNDENSIFAFFENMIDFDILVKAIKYYNEDIVVKIIMLYDEILYDGNQFNFIYYILNYLSKKMILPLLDRILPLLPKTSYTDFAEGFREQDCFEIYNYVMDYISKNDQ